MKFSEVPSFDRRKGRFPGSLPEDPLEYQACEDVWESFLQALPLCSIAEAREQLRPEFQNMLKGHFNDFKDRLKDWLENYPGDKRIALGIAITEWSDHCDLSELSAALQRSNSAEESFRNSGL
ncbi:hypothetical protein FIE12Z_454 [Fusarium flagelliforme]|uniref:Uncharacterized protein n=1 Tax=Fusarium flagelliforme TaxID=2675880 RepID=A0A395N514_9HYPO|nr:hypothetical protein FIE12Z_454 [Fusarium flagelliforme]